MLYDDNCIKPWSDEYMLVKLLTKSSVRSGGLAVKYPALGANGHRFEPRKRSTLFQMMMMNDVLRLLLCTK